MKNQGLHELFVTELEDMYDSENQIIKSLPNLIKLASTAELKEALKQHLEETENQVKRIKEIFSILHLSPKTKTCTAMKGLLREAEEIVANKAKSPTLDAAIISAAQKVEHYEIASYGTLRSWANHLDFDSKVCDLLDDSLDEESTADKALTKIADGSLFTTGVNKEAAEHTTLNRKAKR